ncbi:MAG TPA: formyltransferase family protein [Candidatus Saccharimonadales bacterium]|nr:formyltransferase family protein [Candidatus Saccharimonadales bacterium]
MNGLRNPRVVGFASGTGTTFEAFGHSVVSQKLGIEVVGLICDRPAGAAQKALGLNATYGWGIRTEVIDRQHYPAGPTDRRWDLTDAQSRRMLEFCREVDAGLLVLMGFLSRVRGTLFDAYGALDTHEAIEEAAMVNTHPGDPDDTKGLYGHAVHAAAHQRARAPGGSPWTAQVLHVVKERYDEGAVIKRNSVAILPTYTIDDVEAAVQATEKSHIARDVYDFMVSRESYQDSQRAA